MTESPGVRPPTQARSHRTFTALLDATEELLEDRLFADVSVQDIVDRASSSAGSFYARFASKKALLGALQDRLHDAMKAGPDDVPDDWEPGEVSARLFAETFVDKIATDHSFHEGLIRALIMEAQTDSTIIEKSMVLHHEDAEFVAPYLKAPGRTEKEKADAVAMASMVLLAVLNQRVLYRRDSADDSSTDDSAGDGSQAKDGLVDIFLAALDL